MGTDVIVPGYLLENLFSLLDYLDRLARRDDMNSRLADYSPRFETDTAIWDLKMKIMQLRSHIVETYLLTVDCVTVNERQNLMSWVADGYSVYENPYSLHDDKGNPMDFINGCRVGADMAVNHESYFEGLHLVFEDDCHEDDLPF